MKSGPAGGVTRVSRRRRLRARCDLGASGQATFARAFCLHRETITPHLGTSLGAPQSRRTRDRWLHRHRATSPAHSRIFGRRVRLLTLGLPSSTAANRVVYRTGGMPPHDDETKDARRRICIHNRFSCTGGRQRANQGHAQSAAVASAGEARRSRHPGQGIVRPPAYAGASSKRASSASTPRAASPAPRRCRSTARPGR